MSSDSASSDDPDPGGGAPTAEDGTETDGRVAVGEYTWADYMTEYGFGDQVSAVFGTSAAAADDGRAPGATLDSTDPAPEGSADGDGRAAPGGIRDRLVPGALGGSNDGGRFQLGGVLGKLGGAVRSGGNGDGRRLDWGATSFDPARALGFPPTRLRDRIRDGAGAAARLDAAFDDWLETTPVRKGEYTWEHFKQEFYYDADGDRPREDGEAEPFDPADHLGFDPEDIESVLAGGADEAMQLGVLADERTVDVDPAVDEDEFFSDGDGNTTMVNRYDLEKAVPPREKRYLREVERYWVDKPHAFVVIFHSRRENEKKYYLVDPHRNEIETELADYLAEKLRTAIKYSDDELVVQGPKQDRKESVLRDEITRFLDRYDLRADPPGDDRGLVGQVRGLVDGDRPDGDGADGQLDGIAARPEPAVLAEDAGQLTEYQVEKLLYLLTRNFLGYERIDGIKHDINVEDISCDGYDAPVFVYHTDHENLITNVDHGSAELDDFVVKLAQRSGKGISKRNPQVDATLPDGSRAQLTLGREVSGHGTNYTIRQFKDVPFTPVDLINWNTFSLDEMAFLWLCIENHNSALIAGGTASGKTTALNALSLFIPSNAKIVSIEDTREVELPQRNWVSSVTRPSFRADDTGDVDEFDLLEAALRQRPDYIVMGEVRGEEGRTLFQVMSTGHTTYTTFHAASVGEVLKRFTTDPINVSKTLFTALDFVIVQTQTSVRGETVRRNKTITEITDYDADNDEIKVQDVFQWQPDGDEFRKLGRSEKLSSIAFDRGWSRDRTDEELFKRKAVLAYLIDRGLNSYAHVAATVQAFMNDPETILTLIANDDLGPRLRDLQGMESVQIDVDPDKEAIVPRPDPGEAVRSETDAVLTEARDRLLSAYEGEEPKSLVRSLPSMSGGEAVVAGAEDANLRELALDRLTDGESAEDHTLGDLLDSLTDADDGRRDPAPERLPGGEDAADD